MSIPASPIEGFALGETASFTLLGRERDGSVLSTPGSQTITFTLSDSPGGAPVIEESTDGANVVLEDVANAEFVITITPTVQTSASIAAGRTYYYNVWSNDGAGVVLRQLHGTMVFDESIPPS